MSKTNDAEATLRKDSLPKPAKVKEVNPEANAGLAAKLASAAVDNNPKKRTCNTSGGKTVLGTGEEN